MSQFYIVVAGLYLVMAVVYGICYNIQINEVKSKKISPGLIETCTVVSIAIILVVYVAESTVPQAVSIFVQITYAAWLTAIIISHFNHDTYEREDRFKLVGQVTMVICIIMGTAGWITSK